LEKFPIYAVTPEGAAAINSAIPQTGVVNLVASPWNFVNDGLTDNWPNYQTWYSLCNTLTASWPYTVTFTQGAGNVAVCNWANHGLSWNDIISFTGTTPTTTGGVLPAGITAGTLYAILSSNFTPNSFEFAQLSGVIGANNLGVAGNQNFNFAGVSLPGIGFIDSLEGAPIVISTTGSGTLGCVVHNYDWVEVRIPAGNYYSSVADFTGLVAGQRRIKFHADGAKLWDVNVAISLGAIGTMGQQMNADGDGYGAANCWGYVNTINQAGGTSHVTITLKTPSLASLFYPNQWVCLMALDLQEGTGGPPNNHYFQYLQLSSVNTSTGVLTAYLQSFQMLESFLDTFPTWNAGTPGANALCTGGAAAVVGMPSNWNTDIVWEGLHCFGTFETDVFARRATFLDCVFDGQGCVPTTNQSFRMERCKNGSGNSTFSSSSGGVVEGVIGGFGQGLQFDKLVEQATFVDCVFDGITVSGSSMKNITFDQCRIGVLNGTGRRNRFVDCVINQMLFGCGYGAMDNLELVNCQVDSFVPYYNYQAPALLPQLWTFSNGTLKIALNPWLGITGKEWSQVAVPGSKWYLCPYGQGFTLANVGFPFTILNVWTDGSSNFCVDTDLAALPVGASTSSAVTVTSGSPAVINWTAHGLTAGTPVVFYASFGATLPTGMSANTLYYVLAAGLTANTFEFSTSVGGSAVNTTGSLTGTLHCVGNPLQMLQHPASRITVRNCVGNTSLADHNGVSDVPMYSRIKRSYWGPGINDTTMPIWGNLVSLTINVVRPYTGSGGFTLALTGTGYTTGGAVSAFSETVDCTVAGLRTITATTTTGSAGADSISAYANWLGSQLSAVSTGGNFSIMDQNPVVEIFMQTDQGITGYHTLEATWLSAAYLSGKSQTLTDSANNSNFTI